MKVTLVCSPGNARKEFIDVAGKGSEGVVVPTGKILFPETYGERSVAKILADDFVKEYRKLYHVSPLDDGTYPGHAYGSFYVVVRALERLNKPPSKVTGPMLRNEIERTKKLALFLRQFHIFTDRPFGN